MIFFIKRQHYLWLRVLHNPFFFRIFVSETFILGNHLKFTPMKQDPKNLAGVFEENEIQARQPDANPTQEMGGEVWYQ